MGLHMEIGLHCFVERQNVALGLLIQQVDIVVGQVDDPHPAAGRINDYRGGETFCLSRI